MHELSITRSLLDQALAEAEKHGAKRISRIRLLLGEGGGVVPDCVQFYFDEMKKGTPAAEAELEFKTVPLRIRCPKCGTEWGPSFRKPAQGSATTLTPPSPCEGEGKTGTVPRRVGRRRSEGLSPVFPKSSPKPLHESQGADSGSEFDASIFDGMCACNAGGEVVSGQELVIESIDVD
jgi:hydrogenase nickel incorporation protein HypA/HybF